MAEFMKGPYGVLDGTQLGMSDALVYANHEFADGATEKVTLARIAPPNIRDVEIDVAAYARLFAEAWSMRELLIEAREALSNTLEVLLDPVCPAHRSDIEEVKASIVAISRLLAKIEGKS